MILSIQSGVVFGAVGNTAAQSVYSSLNVHTGFIYTGLFSSPLDVPKASGKLISTSDLEAVFAGVLANPDLPMVTHVVSGFLGSSATAQLVSEFIQEIRKRQPLEYLCDPVMGDFGVGYYVDKSIRDVYEKYLLPQANYVLPNAFEAVELGYLDKNFAVQSSSVANALLVVKGIPHSEELLKVALIENGKGVEFLETRRFQGRFRGAGDFFSALFLASLISGKSPQEAASYATTQMESIIAYAFHSKSEDLRLPKQ